MEIFFGEGAFLPEDCFQENNAFVYRKDRKGHPAFLFPGIFQLEIVAYLFRNIDGHKLGIPEPSHCAKPNLFGKYRMLWGSTPQGPKDSEITGHLQLTLFYLPTKFGGDWTWGGGSKSFPKQDAPREVFFGEMSCTGFGVYRMVPA